MVYVVEKLSGGVMVETERTDDIGAANRAVRDHLVAGATYARSYDLANGRPPEPAV